MRIVKRLPYHLLCIISTFFVADNAFSQIEFIENKGQWSSEVKFMSIAGSGSFYLQQNGFTVAQHNPDDVENIKERRHREFSGAALKAGARLKPEAPAKIRSHAYTVKFLNAQNAQILPDRPIPATSNYFIGNDKSKWASGCRIFKGVTYKDVYPGIDIRYYSDAASNLKYDFIVHPGADVNNIAMKYTGANKISVKNKQLIIGTSLGDNKELSPYTYQVTDNSREELDCRYVVEGDVVKFKVKNYAHDKVLIIDPTEKFFSYSGSTADNWGFTATYGPDGSFYGGGIAFNSGFPVSTGSYDETFSDDFDIAIIKLTPDGKSRVYATYIGGNSSEQPHSLIVDPQGNLVIAGRSKSTNSADPALNYPTTVPVYGPGGGWDIVVTKLNASGSGLIGSMRIGGLQDDGVNIKDETASSGGSSLKRNYGDDARSEVLLDGSNNIYLASCTSSADYKTTPGAFQSKIGGEQDGVVLKINPDCNTVLFSTFLGGSGNDASYVLTLGSTNNIYVAGGTASTDMRGISAGGVISSSFQGGICDGYVIELNNSGTAAIRGTYLGTALADQIYGIETDKFGFIYVMGTSEGSWKVINAAYSNLNAKQFISKLKPDLSDYVYSTVFGSSGAVTQLPNISPTAFLVDRCENVYVSGWGGKSNTGFGEGSTKGMPVTPDAIKGQTDASGSDFYFFVLKKDAAAQLYGSFFGQEDPPLGVNDPVTFGDHVDGGTSRFDRNGVIYQAMCANCFRTVPFPGTFGAWFTSNQATAGGQCNLGMLKIEMDFAGVQAGVRASIDGVPYDTIGCVPLRVDFIDTLNKGKSYYWSFGDGTGDTTTGPANFHIYNTRGNFRVRLIAVDSTTCNIFDTAYTNIRVGDNKVVLNFVSSKLPPCTNLSYSFTNTSVASRGPFNPGTFTWDFGDNTPTVTQGQSPPVNHTYAGPGTYIVKLSIDDTTFCNSPDDTVKTVRLSPQVKAQFETPAHGCVPYNAVFTNNSLGGLNFFWDFGDGTSSTEDNPVHLYDRVGTFIVKLKAFDSTSCNKIDSSSFTITVSPIPVASFIYNPDPPQENVFTNFLNQSTGATIYNWNFGDGETSTGENPTHIFPETASFKVCLNAANDAGCSDDTCVIIKALIKPLVDVPSAFTPGKFGINGRIKVEGFGIAEMHWSIYNRWGQKVYETNNRKSAWDGTFNGKLQPLDVYAYTLDVTFSDGTKYRKTGDITLLR
ncbi:MAG: PKD domain-containing protein [Ginsengibacter sp.]